ncbi:NUDIX domain-containing protein [Comamonas composti]|uniref:NUDIX domain-containing protein n=1 Tax=Comamonas composti TaxID=408558 RepID=UPI0003FAFE55|nr:NUDIX domain-containing protein [Comamonas composti]
MKANCVAESPPGIAAWLQKARAWACSPPLQPRAPLWLGSHEVGSLQAELVHALPTALLQAHGIALVAHESHEAGWRLVGRGDATADLNALALVLRDAGQCGPWRDEQLLVCDDEGKALATVERGAVRPLGIATRAVYLVGESEDGRVWVQQRSEAKPNNPGMWDALVGGMVGAQDDVQQALARETREEAGIALAQLSGLRHGGRLALSSPSDEAGGFGYMRERSDWFCATLVAGLLPRNQDGEVQAFALLEREQLVQWLLKDHFTPEAALIMAAWLGW